MCGVNESQNVYPISGFDHYLSMVICAKLGDFCQCEHSKLTMALDEILVHVPANDWLILLILVCVLIDSYTQSIGKFNHHPRSRS